MRATATIITVMTMARGVAPGAYGAGYPPPAGRTLRCES